MQNGTQDGDMTVTWPRIVQGGMGAGVSDWRLARAVAETGEMGVVSGTALDTVLARRLQMGDPGGDIRRALGSFPRPDMAQRVLDTYFIAGGKAADAPFRLVPMPTPPMRQANTELLIVANYVEVFLAKEGHSGPVGINYLEKIQFPTLPSLLGALLAGIDYVLMGGGIPLGIPGALDRLSRWESAELPLDVDMEQVADQAGYTLCLDPREMFGDPLPELRRPRFLAIVSSDVVAKALLQRATGAIDGFIVENYTAGGHNAPPRRAGKSRPDYAPQYGPKDVPDLAKVADLGKPFWLGGSYASPEKVREALEAGAAGVQVGTPFALCRESGIMSTIKEMVIRGWLADGVEVVTDFRASPTGYPFKLVHWNDPAAGPAHFAHRERVCDLGYLRQFYANGNDRLGYRCPAEPVEMYVRKGGDEQDTIGRQCLCNGLVATIGLAQIRGAGIEPPMVTSGEDLSFLTHLVTKECIDYGATDVLRYLKGDAGNG